MVMRTENLFKNANETARAGHTMIIKMRIKMIRTMIFEKKEVSWEPMLG
jgi:hypothetical protein